MEQTIVEDEIEIHHMRGSLVFNFFEIVNYAAVDKTKIQIRKYGNEYELWSKDRDGTKITIKLTKKLCSIQVDNYISTTDYVNLILDSHMRMIDAILRQYCDL